MIDGETSEPHALCMAFHWRRYPHHRLENHSLLAHGFRQSFVRRVGVTCQSRRRAYGARHADRRGASSR
jgi:hypothetical protein